MTVATAPLAAGAEIVPGYRVVGLLCHGRRVDTYDVYSEQRDCRCVVKVLRPDRAHEPRVRAAVELEGTLLRDLAHPHLVRCYEVVEGPLPAMVLQTLGGATLDAVIEDGSLDAVDSAQLGLQLASVLGYLHRCGWLHLDVKPSNVVVEAGRATLIDLSLVGTVGSGRPGAGTRGYLAPEQARGDGLCAASDVWGLGITLVESITGELPFGDEATWGSRRRLLGLVRRVPRTLRRLPDLPPDYAEMLRACLERDPGARPTLDEVRTRLAAVVDAPPNRRSPDPSGARRHEGELR